MKKISRVTAAADLVLISNLSFILRTLNLNILILYLSMGILMLYFIIFNIIPSNEKSMSLRLKIMYDGRELAIIFAYGFMFNVICFIIWSRMITLSVGDIVSYAVFTLAMGAIVIFNGVVRMFVTSRQVGILRRILLISFWWMPVFNICLIAGICRLVYNEYILENDKIILNNTRKENEICKTRYPILMVHGVFFRDSRFFNYWGRVPAELIRNGAVVYYGGQHSAASVESCANELKAKIEEIVRTTGCGKVNIIAHSKGGLDSRYAISCLGMDKYTASLTTVNTPHLGCEYADFILERMPSGVKNFLANRYNSSLKKFGEENPDFISAITDLTATNCRNRNECVHNMPEVYYQSIGSKMKKASSAGFPLNVTYHIVKLFCHRDNDGLVDIESMKWGQRHIFFEPRTKRGLSHGDLIDLMREDIKGFDVREEYVKIVAELKAMGF